MQKSCCITEFNYDENLIAFDLPKLNKFLFDISESHYSKIFNDVLTELEYIINYFQFSVYSILYMNVSTLTRIDCPLPQSNFKTCQMLRWEMATQFFNLQ